MARSIACVNNLKQIGLATMLYSNDNEGWLPESSGDGAYWYNGNRPNAIGRYLKYETYWPPYPGIAYCPAEMTRPEGQSQKAISYAMNYITLGSYDRVDSLSQPSKVVFLIDSLPNQTTIRGVVDNLERLSYRHNGKANAWFLDGHVESLESIAIELLQKK